VLFQGLKSVLAPTGEILSFVRSRQLLLHCSTTYIPGEKKVSKEKAALYRPAATLSGLSRLKNRCSARQKGFIGCVQTVKVMSLNNNLLGLVLLECGIGLFAPVI